MPKHDELDETLDELKHLARSVFDGVISDVDADRQRAELCTRHGPTSVQALDTYFDAELARLRKRSESSR